MNNALKSLINYVQVAKLGFKVVGVYTNQFKISKTDLKIIEISTLLPSCLIVVGNSKPVASPPVFEFDLFITTQSVSFQADKNTDANILLTTQVTDFINRYNTFEYTINNNLFEYNILLDQVTVTPFMVNDKYAIYLLHLALEQLV